MGILFILRILHWSNSEYMIMKLLNGCTGPSLRFKEFFYTSNPEFEAELRLMNFSNSKLRQN